MSNWRDLSVAVAALLLSAGALAQAAAPAWPGIGRPATPKEVIAWDIDVRPDLRGLPPGRGSVAKGQEVWEAKCASCHGVFGESGEVFNPLIGGTTAADIASGRVARLTDPGYPGRTTLMKVPHVSTLWDYINRAMPWNQPKSLSTEDVYAVTAFMLNLGGIVPDNFTLSDANMAEVQQRMPNRNGLSTQHGLWPGKEFGGTGRPDVQGSACMRDCASEPKVASLLPDFARDSHGNLADQSRLVGAQRGADTRRAGTTAAAAATAAAPAAASDSATALLGKNNCLACHGMESRIVGPGFREIARRHDGRTDATAYFARKIVGGGSGVWGAIPMPPQALPDAELQSIARWLAAGAKP